MFLFINFCMQINIWEVIIYDQELLTKTCIITPCRLVPITANSIKIYCLRLGNWLSSLSAVWPVGGKAFYAIQAV